MEWFGLNIEILTQLIVNHLFVAELAVFFTSFSESLAILGMVMPGAILMPIIGFFIGSSIISWRLTLIVVTVGALTGDYISYFLGRKLQNRIDKIWPFTRWPQLLIQSRNFFDQHGGKGIIICRFIGPMRALVPMTVGACNFPLWRFTVAAVPAALAWAVVYMLPGILFGALAVEVPAKLLGKLLLWALIGLIIFWLGWYGIKFSYRFLVAKVQQLIFRFYRKLSNHSIGDFLRSLDNKLLKTRTPGLDSLKDLIVLVILWLCLVYLILQVKSGGIIVEISRNIYYLISSIRIDWLDQILVGFTVLGNWKLIALWSLGIAIIFVLEGTKHTLKCWCLLVLGAIGSAATLKELLLASRPEGGAYNAISPAFPSAHVLLSVAVYGFFVLILMQYTNKTTKRNWLKWIIIALVSLMVFSRLYLGAHWLTDIAGGLVVGMMLLIVAKLFYQRGPYEIIHLRRLKYGAAILLAILWGKMGIIDHAQHAANYRLPWSTTKLTLAALKNNQNNLLPIYRYDRLGRPIEAINFVYIGNLTILEQQLSKCGWEKRPNNLGWDGMVRKMLPNTVENHLPWLPQLYHNVGTALLMTKNIEQKDNLLILRLWPSDVQLTDHTASVWIGNVEQHQLCPTFFYFSTRFAPKHFVGATKIIAGDLAAFFQIFHKKYQITDQITDRDKLIWDGKVIVVVKNS